MSDNRGALLRAGDTWAQDNFALGMHMQPVAGVVIPSGDYSVADPAPTELALLGVQSLLFVIDVTAISGAGAQVAVNIERFDPGRPGAVPPDHGFFPGLTTITLTAVGTVYCMIDPWLAATSGALGGFGALSVALQTNVPRQLRVRPVKGGTTTTLTYSVGLHTM